MVTGIPRNAWRRKKGLLKKLNAPLIERNGAELFEEFIPKLLERLSVLLIHWFSGWNVHLSWIDGRPVLIDPVAGMGARGQPGTSHFSDQIPLGDPFASTDRPTGEMEVHAGIHAVVTDLHIIPVPARITRFHNMAVPYGPDRRPTRRCIIHTVMSPVFPEHGVVASGGES